MYKSNYCYLPRTTAKISHCFRCYFAAGDLKGEDFRGDGEKPGCFFAAFNSDISERCSILHTSRKVGLVAHGSGHRPARRQGSGKAIVDQPAAASPKGPRATRVARQGRDRCIARRPLLGGRARIFKIEDHRVDVEGQRLLDPPYSDDYANHRASPRQRRMRS